MSSFLPCITNIQCEYNSSSLFIFFLFLSSVLFFLILSPVVFSVFLITSPAPLTHQFRVHGPLQASGPACVFLRAASGVSNPLHRRPRLHQWHRDIGSLGQRDGENRLGPSQVEENSGAGGAELWGQELWRTAVWTGKLERTRRAVMKKWRGGREKKAVIVGGNG